MNIYFANYLELQDQNLSILVFSHKWQFGCTMNYVRYNFRALRSDASDPSKSPKHWQACSIIILITVLLPQFGMDFFAYVYECGF